MKPTIHVPVLLEESLDALLPKRGGVYVDATFGGGGHSLALLRRLETLGGGTVVGIDQDPVAIERFQAAYATDPWVQARLSSGALQLVQGNFVELDALLPEGMVVDGVLADLGISSDQLEDDTLGISYRVESPLDMRLDRSADLTAADILNTWDAEELIRIFRESGEKFAVPIAKTIVSVRGATPLSTTGDLVRIVESMVKQRFGEIHPATRVFQALRIAVNEEIAVIPTFIRAAIQRLRVGGRLAIIAFHSGEDEVVKQIFQTLAKPCVCPPEFPVCQCGRVAEVAKITSKPTVPSETEVTHNPRSRSSRLRVIQKI
jgi:16S rRNA (cytosine1402-N4)-methyltransferase